MGYASFTLCEILALSGVISALVAGVLMAHYNFYNMSPIGKVSSQVTVQGVSMICESFIYIYLGVSVWNLKSNKIKEEEQAVSWTLILAEIVITFIARGLALSILSIIAKLIQGKKWRLTLPEISIIWFAGLIRGSVAYALI